MSKNVQEQALIHLYEIIVKRMLVIDSQSAAQETLALIVDSARSVLLADAVTLYEYSESSKEFRRPLASGLFYDGRLLSSEMPIFWNEEDISDFKESFTRREKIKTVVAIPLTIGKEPVGIIFVNYRTPKKFSENQRRLIALFADQAALAIKYTRMMESKQDDLIQPPKYYSCFISHSSKDSMFVEKLYRDLSSKNIACWYAPHDLKIGDNIRAKIDDVVMQHDKLLLVLSGASITSQWVEQEVETALEKEKKKKLTVLFPIRLDDKAMKSKIGWAKLIRNTRNIGDFSNWTEEKAYQESLNRLLSDLEKRSS